MFLSINIKREQEFNFMTQTADVCNLTDTEGGSQCLC